MDFCLLFIWGSLGDAQESNCRIFWLESLSCGWCSKEVLGTFGVGVWKHSRRGLDKSLTTLFDLRRGLGLK